MKTSDTKVYRGGRTRPYLRYETSEVDVVHRLTEGLAISFSLGAAGGTTNVRVVVGKKDIPLLLRTISDVLNPPPVRLLISN